MTLYSSLNHKGNLCIQPKEYIEDGWYIEEMLTENAKNAFWIYEIPEFGGAVSLIDIKDSLIEALRIVERLV